MTGFYVVWVWIVTVIISLGIERFIQPSVPNIYRFYAAYLLHVSIISLFYFLSLLIVQRPIFSSLFVLITHAIFVVVSNAKYKALKEPLVFSDIVMFSQAFKYPRLYFPFLGWLPIIGAPVIIVAAIALVLRFESTSELNYFWLMLSLLMSIVLMYTMALKQTPCLNIAQDIQQIGFIASLISYEILARQDTHKKQIENTLKNTLWQKTKKNNKQQDIQDIVVIQSESFFDARRLHPSISHHVLSNFDQCCAESLQYGCLNVSAWGANTMRTEFSFLSGIGFEEMGYYRFYPYHYMRHYQVATFASYLQQKGYYCICIHPHHAKFFGRARLFPQLGFDEFIDIVSFSETDKYGPYISDQAVSKKIIEILALKREDNKPCFIFAITMENHGPLHLEKATAEDKEKYYTGIQPNNTNELSIYLRHLNNADETIGDLMTTLKEHEKNTLFCLYGDHVPSMPAIYAETAFNDNRTDYVIWSSIAIKNKKYNKKDISAQCLAKQIKKIIGD
jgi:phosphoglycerol transferase MdoB-like AlkP superfamily enzyme